MTEASWLQGLWFPPLYWRQPLWLLLALQPFILFLIQRLSSKRRLACYADPALHAWVSLQQGQAAGRWSQWATSRQSLYVVGWLLMATSMAGPRLLLEQPAAAGDPDVNIMLVVDVSRSMQARDIEPTRLRRAQIEINEFLDLTTNDRIGLILYSGRAHLLVPFTSDINALKYYLSLLESVPLPTLGSSAASALEMAKREIDTAGVANQSVILWLTDGDFASTGFTDKNTETANDVEQVARGLANASIPLYILGTGTVEGDAIPLADGKWLQHEGRPVISRMDEKFLTELSAITKGRFIIAQDDDSDWNHLYQQGISASNPLLVKTGSIEDSVWQELYPWTLLPAIVLLFISLMPHLKTRQITAWLLPSAGLLFFTLSPALLPINHASAAERSIAEESTLERQAYQYFDRGNFNQAADFYRRLTGYKGRLGEGSCYYRAGKYTHAITQFSQAVMLAETDQQRGSAIYNLANTTFMLGDYAGAADLYRDALIYRPSHRATSNNLTISLSLKRLVEQQLMSGRTNRMGSGLATMRANQGLDVNEDGSIFFDNDEERKKVFIPLPEIPAKELEALLARGLAHAQLADNSRQDISGSTSNNQPQWHQDINTVRIRMLELEDRQQLLWKRLFEMEEGFVAPVEEAKTIPGVLPW